MVMPAKTYVMDASALLAVARGERGADVVSDYLDSEQCVISAINLAEVGSKLVDLGLPESELARALKQFNVAVIDADFELALSVSALRTQTKALGLSLGDRSCLALARHLKGIAITADKAWADLDESLGCLVMQIR
jgi:ribonuclease VapC